ncbi:MAG: hypothetical protein QNK04_17980 [Myxococcota bacterium]|nr:hypothetical protein [Myxococcota bacterium]
MSAYDWLGLDPEGARARVARRDPHDFPFLCIPDPGGRPVVCAFASPDELLDFVEDVVVQTWTGDPQKRTAIRRRIAEARMRIGSHDLSDALFEAVAAAFESPPQPVLESWGPVDRYAADPAPSFAAVRDAFRCARGIDTGDRFEAIRKGHVEAFLAFLRRS